MDEPHLMAAARYVAMNRHDHDRWDGSGLALVERPRPIRRGR
jgi:hypothetical protein